MNKTGTFTALGDVAKNGFETSFTAEKFYAWSYVNALGSGGKVLGTAPVRQTYAPHLNETVPNTPDSNGSSVAAS
jgi:hypothetical protein